MTNEADKPKSVKSDGKKFINENIENNENNQI